MLDNETTLRFFSVALSLLACATVAAFILRKLVKTDVHREITRIISARIFTWWAMCVVFALAMLTGGRGSILMFAFSSFLLMREFITITPTRKGDHHVLFWVFFVILPMQYYVLYLEWYGLFIILIPVYAFLLLPIRMAMAGDPSRFLERAAKIQWSLMICVYCVSYAPALLMLKIPGHEGVGPRLLFFLVLVVQVNDIVHRVVDKWLGKHPYAKKLNDKLSWEGLVSGAIASTTLGACLFWATPFSALQAAAMALLCAMLGNAGILCYHAIRQDRHGKGVVIVETRQSATERIISLCVAAPVFFHFVRYYFLDQSLQMF